MTKFVYSFDEGNKDMREILGVISIMMIKKQ